MDYRSPQASSRLILLLTLLTLLFTTLPLSADEPVQVAVLGLENLNRDPRYDYLEGMIIGVLMYDLIRTEDISLVERARIERIFDEQSLRLSGLLSDADTAKQVGQLMGADYLISGDYAFLGRDVSVNLNLLNVDDSSITPFAVRGYTENTVHELAENIIEELLGKPIILAGTDGERSLLSLSDEEPGSIEFYCNFIDGEIFVDEEFYGYTPGGTVPTLLEDLSPGDHIIRLEAGPNFGEIEWPHMAFIDWQRTIKVKADRKSVLRASVYHFNSLIYDAMEIYRENWRIGGEYETSLSIREDSSFTDRNGRVVPVILVLDASTDGENINIAFTLDADGISKEWFIESNTDEIDFEEQVGPVEIEFERDWYSNSYWDFDIKLTRTDIHQGMHRE